MSSTLKRFLVWLVDYLIYWLILVHGIVFIFILVVLNFFVYRGADAVALAKLAGIITLCSLITSTPAYFLVSFPGVEMYRASPESYLVYGAIFGLNALVGSMIIGQPHPRILAVGITLFATGGALIVTTTGLVRRSLYRRNI